MIDIQNAKTVIKTEIAGLQALEQSINDDFAAAIDTIHTMKDSGKGRLIVAGIGKSGHVCRKMAATLASTGTPAYFVHPGEASHGDLGMITPNDVVLMLSNSGENSELSDLIHYTRRFDIPLIAMTSKRGSTLGTHADIVLELPQAEEACPNGMAPTTSTTMMIALGDAIAVCLLHRMNLSKDDFQVFHPGGKLGQKLARISALMVKKNDLAIVKPNDTMDKAIIVLSEKNLGAVLVMDDETLKGIITDGDLKRHMSADLMSKTVSDIMSANPKTIDETELAAKALHIMTKTPNQYLTSLIVTDKNNAVSGLIRLQDCLQAGVE